MDESVLSSIAKVFNGINNNCFSIVEFYYSFCSLKIGQNLRFIDRFVMFLIFNLDAKNKIIVGM